LPPDLAEELHATSRRQALAANPTVSAWVSANAGTGKTHVLTNRVLRLLVAGTPPERLLCLTYTKAAAAEMSSRVFNRLSGWVTIDDHDLHDALSGLLERHPTPEETGRARDLFTRALETPGGLKVQTIHAFCERLLQRFPLEAGVPPGFTILDDETKAALVREAASFVLEAASDAPDSDLGRALAIAVRHAADDNFERLLADVMARHDWLEQASRIDLGSLRDFDAVARLYREAFGLVRGDTTEGLEAQQADVLKTPQLTRARDVLASGSKEDQGRAETLSKVIAANGVAARISRLRAFFLTTDGDPRKRLMTKRLATDHAELASGLEAAQTRFCELTRKIGCLAVADATVAVTRFAHAALQRYQDLKAQRAALDFDDLIRASGSLLGDTADAQWVLYKLDGGLDHILVDEAQDTSPTQWRVIRALADEFLAGAGGRELDTGIPRTVFAVGDEKQSIYGFQGAAPKMFADMGQLFETAARAAGLDFERVPLTLSFRTVAPVLEAVDRIFAEPGRARGLTSTGEIPKHTAHRHGMAGLVELWETEKPDEAEPAPAWQPLEEIARSVPAIRLAERIADTIAGWIASGEMLASEGRPINYGDILILVRRRRPFADLMVSTLKKRGVPVAGADRLRLTDQLAVLDLMALADVLLLPEDDLALASVLKSPLFGLDDDDLLRLASGRRGSLWSALLAAARTGVRYAPAAEQLKRWRSRADVVPPYEFLVEVLVHDGMRAKLLGRLGPDAADPLDELLALALAYDEQAPPSLQGFMDWLRQSDRDIKRDMEHGRGEVRVMTVHGSKGLEAPMVILPDTCAGLGGGRAAAPVGAPGLLSLPMGMSAEPFLWPVKGSSIVDEVRAARATAREKDAEEHTRLLYVALTRARDRLYVCGFEGGRGREAGCWYDAIEAGLAGVLTETKDAAGLPVRRLEAAQTHAAEVPKPKAHAIVAAISPPEWARAKAPREPGFAIPLAPSRLAPLEVDTEGDPVEPSRRSPAREEPSAPSPRIIAEGNRFLRGTLTHALLQYLPDLSVADRAPAAEAFVRARGSSLSAATRASIVGETLAVLSSPTFAAVFGPGSRAEVPIVADLAPPDGKGRAIRLTGQIDRLIATDREVLIVDFKSNRPPPQEVAQVADAYLLQLAAYRLAMAHIFPDRPVRAALLWTDGPNLMELPPARLDDAAERLFLLDQPDLDA